MILADSVADAIPESFGLIMALALVVLLAITALAFVFAFLAFRPKRSWPCFASASLICFSPTTTIAASVVFETASKIPIYFFLGGVAAAFALGVAGLIDCFLHQDKARDFEVVLWTFGPLVLILFWFS